MMEMHERESRHPRRTPRPRQADSRSVLLDAPGVVDVDIVVTHEPPWSPALMTPAARRMLGLPA